MKSLFGIGRPAWRCVDRARQGTCAAIADLGLRLNCFGDLDCEFLAVGCVGGKTAVASVAEVAAFDQHAGNFRITGEAQAAPYEATVAFLGGTG